MATQRQIDLMIVPLVSERYKSMGFDNLDAALIALPLAEMSTRQTSELIDRLKAIPRDPDPTMPDHLAEYRTARTNDSAGNCESCGHLVPARGGFFFGPHGTGSKWRVHHKVGECSDAPAPTQVDVEEGYYTGPGGETIQVYLTRNNRLGGKVWDGSRFSYQKGAIALAANGHRVTAEEASAFGAANGACMFCVRPLTDDRSVKVGYGPTCADNQGLPWG